MSVPGYLYAGRKERRLRWIRRMSESWLQRIRGVDTDEHRLAEVNE